MADLATVTDLEARLGRDLDATEIIRAEALLAGASARVRSYTGQTFELATTTDRIRLRNGRLRLPQRPVVVVSAITTVDGTSPTFEWHGGDSVSLLAIHPQNWFSVEPYRYGYPQWVDVTYTHGYEVIPADVVEVVCSIVLRAFGIAADQSGYTRGSIDDFSFQVGPVAAAGVVGLLDEERAALAPYRRHGGTIRVA